MTIRACPSHGHRVAPRQGRSRFRAAAVASHALQQLSPGSLEPSRAGRAGRVASGAQRRGSRPRHSVRACGEPLLAANARRRLSMMKRRRPGQFIESQVRPEAKQASSDNRHSTKQRERSRMKRGRYQYWYLAGQSQFCRKRARRFFDVATIDVHDAAARARGLAVAEAWRSDLAIAEAER